MAEKPMNKFLTQYFRQRIFNSMPEEKFAQYQSIIKNNDFIGHMKDWKDEWKLVTEIRNNNDEVKYVKNEVDPEPDAFGLTPGDADAEKEWESLYKELRNAFRKVASSRDNLDAKDDKKTIEFLNAFYGFGQLFTPAELTGPAADQLNNELLPFMKDNKTNLYQALKDIGIYTDTEKKFSDFINDLGKGKHNTDSEVRDMLAHIISYLQSSYYGPAITERMGGAAIPNLEVLANGLENDDVDPAKLQHFKNNYKLLLNPIYSEKNIFQKFGPHLKTVKSALETARKNVDYDNPDSKDFLTEKREDKKGPIEGQIDKIKGWWDDHTDKYTSLHKSRLFYSEEAKAISKAIDGSKFKPTDGLDKFVESLKDIGSKVKGNKAKQHFKWFSETMTKLQGDKQMKSIFAGALKNPRKLKELAAEIAIQGLKDGKKDEEIFTAMEVLKTIQYGYSTSNHLNAVMSQDFTMFSDKNLSWNKHEGMKFVMTAFDKTISWGIKGTALAITTGYNIANRNIGNKFKGNKSKRIAASYKAHENSLAAQAADKQAQKDLLDGFDRDNKTAAENDIASTGITAATLDAEKRNLEALQITENSTRDTYEQAQTKFKASQDKLRQVDTIIKSQTERQTKLADLNTRLTDLQNQIAAIDAKGDTALNSEIAALANLLQEQQKLTTERDALQTQITDAQSEFASAQRHQPAIKRIYDSRETAFNTARTNYESARNAANDLDTKIEKFKSATERVEESQKRLDKRQEEFDNWQNEDKARFARLMAHWDFLNSGRMRTGENIFSQTLEGILPLSQKDRQKRYDKRKKDVHNAFLAQYQNRYGMVA